MDRRLPTAAIDALIDEFALKSATLGELSWDYSGVTSNRWGQYDVKTQTLRVNPDKQGNDIRRQVMTLIHEIEHWNQHASYSEQVKVAHADATRVQMAFMFVRRYEFYREKFGYVDNPFEIDARDFASKNLDKALETVNRVMSEVR